MTQRFNPVIQSTILKTARNRTVLKKIVFVKSTFAAVEQWIHVGGGRGHNF